MHSALTSLVFRDAGHFQSKFYIVHNFEPWEQRIFLEDHDAIRAGFCHRMTIQYYLPFSRPVKSCQYVKKCCLPTTRGSHKANELSVVYRKIDSLYRSDQLGFVSLDRFELFTDVSDF